MKSIKYLILCSLLSLQAIAQDTFSIVAVDPATGEVGSAGASCVELANFNLPPDFLGDLFPGIGAINSQAYWLSANQDNARTRMEAGDSPQEVIDWLIANDVQNNASTRQYGVVRLINGEPFSAAHTGNNTDDYKGHKTGPTYSIQGNILLDESVLINMENNFLNTEGTLAAKLMAALQGANVVGADSRCSDNGTSSLFAFLKVAQQDDPDGSPSLVLGVSTEDGDNIEPIDSLQTLYDAVFPSGNKEVLYPALKMEIYPQPATDVVQIATSNLPGKTKFTLSLFDSTGKHCFSKVIEEDLMLLQKEEIQSVSQIFWYQLKDEKGNAVRAGKIVFQ
ncbi:MAG: putative Ntn-hydrolase superfamily protein [Patescibacteria group bacterium]|jgi:uncharacterized Ntn-hydrolase superfamily protein